MFDGDALGAALWVDDIDLLDFSLVAVVTSTGFPAKTIDSSDPLFTLNGSHVSSRSDTCDRTESRIVLKAMKIAIGELRHHKYKKAA